jgi:adenosylmethionine-8-amino-7-oxononanoate aminotransferase
VTLAKIVITGETLGDALAVGNVELYKAIYRPLLMDVITAPSPDAYQRAPGETAVDVARRRGARTRGAARRRQADEIAAVIVEPLVQCAGNMRMHDPEHLRIVRAACTRHGVHRIADEIAVGFGRTGTLFACERAAITPRFSSLRRKG